MSFKKTDRNMQVPRNLVACCFRSGNRLIVVRMDVNSGPAVARNAGIWAAKRLGVRLVCFTDADCQPEVSQLRRSFCTQAPGLAARVLITRRAQDASIYVWKLRIKPAPEVHVFACKLGHRQTGRGKLL